MPKGVQVQVLSPVPLKKGSDAKNSVSEPFSLCLIFFIQKSFSKKYIVFHKSANSECQLGITGHGAKNQRITTFNHLSIRFENSLFIKSANSKIMEFT